jgi:hypothetical protein
MFITNYYNHQILYLEKKSYYVKLSRVLHGLHLPTSDLIKFYPILVFDWFIKAYHALDHMQ